jgi:hypothetical protein
MGARSLEYPAGGRRGVVCFGHQNTPPFGIFFFFPFRISLHRVGVGKIKPVSAVI